MGNKFIRQLIEVEIRLGFLYVPSKGIELMPDSTSKIKVVVDGEKRRLQYNSNHRRIFGLTDWYKKIKVKPKDLVEVNKKQDSYEINFVKEEKVNKPETQEKEEKLADLAGVSAQAKGNIIEDRIKELLIIHSDGVLSVYRPVTDTEGIDFIVVQNGKYHPIFIQVKGRFTLHQGKYLILTIKSKTFKYNRRFYVVGAFFNKETLEIGGNIFLIPSEKLKLNKEKGYYRVSASIYNSKGKWGGYMIKKSELASKLLEHFDKIDKY